MPANSPPNLALSDGAARQLANATKTDGADVDHLAPVARAGHGLGPR